MNTFILYPSVPCVFLAVIFIALRWAAVPRNRQRTAWMLLVSLLALPLGVLSTWTANELSSVRPSKYDQFIYQIDNYFGQPSFLLGQICHTHKSALIIAVVSYGLLVAMMVLALAIYIWNAQAEDALLLAMAFVLNLFLCVPFYLAIPVSGPVFAFSGFPFQRPENLAAHMIPIASAPNGIPSVHMSTALLIFWFLRRWRWSMPIGVAYALLTIFATLGLGQHYFFDLICAVPYTVAVYLLATKLRLRSRGNRSRNLNVYETVPPTTVKNDNCETLTSVGVSTIGHLNR